MPARREIITSQAQTYFLFVCLHFVLKQGIFFSNSVGRKRFKVTFSEQQQPYPATASPSPFHSQPGKLTPDEQTTTIVRETKQTHHMIYLSLYRKINQKRCHLQKNPRKARNTFDSSIYTELHQPRSTQNN